MNLRSCFTGLILLGLSLPVGAMFTEGGGDYALFIAKRPVYCVDAKGGSISIDRSRNAMDNPVAASMEAKGPILLVQEDNLRKLPDWFQVFLFYRECGFHQQGIVVTHQGLEPRYTKEQIGAADCFAMRGVVQWARETKSGTPLPQLVREKLSEYAGTSSYPTTASQLEGCAATK